MITETEGDATDPANGPGIIAHVCNDQGGWGRGFVTAVSRRWPNPERAYRRLCHFGDPALGVTQLVQVEPAVWVANMIAQHGYRGPTNPVPLDYAALERCLAAVAGHAVRLEVPVHMPRIGCGLAGGTWDEVAPIIRRTLVDQGITVTVYDLAGRNSNQ